MMKREIVKIKFHFCHLQWQYFSFQLFPLFTFLRELFVWTRYYSRVESPWPNSSSAMEMIQQDIQFAVHFLPRADQCSWIELWCLERLKRKIENWHLTFFSIKFNTNIERWERFAWRWLVQRRWRQCKDKRTFDLVSHYAMTMNCHCRYQQLCRFHARYYVF